MKVTILCGVSGSGKSTYISEHFPEAIVCSADTFFVKNGKYEFDGNKLPEAHSSCLKKFVYLVTTTPNGDRIPVVVDNTNTTVSELAPYAALAQAYGHELEIIIIRADPYVAHGRNTHGVPVEGVMAQHGRLVELAAQLPPWWPVTKVDAAE